MADPIFVRSVEFSHSATQVLQPEVWVVSETVRPPWDIDNGTRPACVCDDRVGIRGAANRDEDTCVVRAAIGHAMQPAQQLGAVLLIGCTWTREPRRTNARQTLQRRATHAGVIRESRQTGSRRGVPCFGERVLNEGIERFRGSMYPERSLSHKLDTERLQQCSEFPLLARVIRGKNQLMHALQTKPSAALCALTRRAMPVRARPSMRSSSCAENGAPSAVACTSTNSPAPVMTTFMSVSQDESSE